jgi:hypothetical protein
MLASRGVRPMSSNSTRFIALAAIVLAADLTANARLALLAAQLAPVQTSSAIPPSSTGLILGRVIDAATDRPVSGAVATLGNAPAQPSSTPGSSQSAVMTNGDGYFLFRDVAPGSYPITVTAPNYVPGANGRSQPEGPSRSVTVEPDARLTDVVIRMWKHGVVSGAILDERGEPVVGVTVRALRRNGTGRLSISSMAVTDDRGIYRIANLIPADYLIALPSTVGALPVSVASVLRAGGAAATELRRELPNIVAPMMVGAMEGTRVGDVRLATNPIGGRAIPPEVRPDGRLTGYATTFHPATTNIGEAQIVQLVSGQERDDVSIQIRAVPMTSIIGTISAPDGPMANVGIRLVPAGLQSAFYDGMDTATTISGPDGRFTLLGVTPGVYRLKVLQQPRRTQTTPMAMTTINLGNTSVIGLGGGGSGFSLGTASPDPTWWADVAVTVADRDVHDVAIVLSAGARVRGRVEFEGGGAPPAASMPRFGINLISADDIAQQTESPVPVGERGEFMTPQHAAGRYHVNVTSIPTGWSVKSAMAGGVDIFEHPLPLSGEDVNGVVVTLTKQPTTLAGLVRRLPGSGDTPALITLFPADYRAWIDEGMSTRRFRSASAQLDGRFEIPGVPAGEYLIAAVTTNRTIDGRSPATIDDLARVALRVVVKDGVNQAPALTVVPLP